MFSSCAIPTPPVGEWYSRSMWPAGWRSARGRVRSILRGMWGRSVKTARILVIDDSAVTRKLVRIALSSEGYEVVEAEDGQRGIEAFSRYRPDLVLQDLL